MGLQARAIEAQVSNTEADTALKIAQATKEAGEAAKKPIELEIEQTNKEITDLEKSLKTQNGIIGLGQTIGGWFSGKNKEKKQREHEKEMMGLQYQYNEAAANNNMTRALEMWRKTGYEAQGQQIENAGLNKALMYGRGGASAVSQ